MYLEEEGGNMTSHARMMGGENLETGRLGRPIAVRLGISLSKLSPQDTLTWALPSPLLRMLS